ncbi:ATP synthase delta chain [Buchnera aphidicola str. Bp (Baizongia pistaciae)]|uniref:ATP synthase subunit delta n=1 Tax=Buchnera aphidicola subsp. Baizongia pistaciae (strain Bp) TaxID=224915 RepID=ATPD_BUCBP|nr:F0F1 ATP synthase subunit delta [Buchnera aphidicola]Q89B42.1 RecName: Full=ATP synthase subunit delta; AltName: Full=ATP synthase F(1) sector subunit delta; AltName: Full=F-type ATPase subunit delta; Short=F-ATPase subunit delta [Buchnera aphidicola str. Bp (Baizongia pistaciae)]AAO26749.1 ATP synthase delta chain [Buchnera aphidicola str. Bp (Baizongia pistaciae)]
MSSTKDELQLYAKAIYNCAISNHQSLDHWKTMLQLMANILNNEIIKNLISKAYFSQHVISLFIDLCCNKVNQYGINLIKILAENKRLMLLEKLYKEFINLCELYQGVVNITVISAHKLNEEYISKINIMLKKRFFKKINVTYVIDESIIGGLIIKFCDTVINASIHSRLEKLLNILQY